MAIENTRVSIIDNNIGVYDPFRIYTFFKYANDPNTIYLRFDDDICYFGDDSVLFLLKARFDNPNAFVVSANIVDNSLISYIHQKIGVLPTTAGKCNYTRLDDIATHGKDFIELTHNTFAAKWITKDLNDYWFTNWHLTEFEPFSISCFAFFGTDLQGINDSDEEMYISSRQPQALNRPNVIAGHAIFVHFAYHTQRPHMDTKPEYYEYYKNLADITCG